MPLTTDVEDGGNREVKDEHDAQKNQASLDQSDAGFMLGVGKVEVGGTRCTSSEYEFTQDVQAEESCKNSAGV